MSLAAVCSYEMFTVADLIEVAGDQPMRVILRPPDPAVT